MLNSEARQWIPHSIVICFSECSGSTAYSRGTNLNWCHLLIQVISLKRTAGSKVGPGQSAHATWILVAQSSATFPKLSLLRPGQAPPHNGTSGKHTGGVTHHHWMSNKPAEAARFFWISISAIKCRPTKNIWDSCDHNIMTYCTVLEISGLYKLTAAITISHNDNMSQWNYNGITMELQ